MGLLESFGITDEIADSLMHKLSGADAMFNMLQVEDLIKNRYTELTQQEAFLLGMTVMEIILRK